MASFASRARKGALAFVWLPIVACGFALDDAQERVGAGDDPLVDVEQTSVKHQSIGNCWIYAATSWAESLHKSATGAELDMSETYWTYWHFFEQIAGGSARTSVETGGWFNSATSLAQRYGVMMERDFARSEEGRPRSALQRQAELAINESLANGALKDRAARRDRALVRAELDRAFGLAPEVVAFLDDVFGKSVDRTLQGKRTVVWTPPPPPPPPVEDGDGGADGGSGSGDGDAGVDAGEDAAVPVDPPPPPPPPAPPEPYFSGVPLRTVYEIAVRIPDPARVRGTQLPLKRDSDFIVVTLADIVPSFSARYGWREVRYPSTASSRRELQRRVQRALHDRQPVVMSWFVDFAYQNRATFTLPEVRPLPGRQGGHLVVAEDYQVDTGGELGVLPAGVTLDHRDPANDAKFLAALAPTAKVEFFRIKNSWGTREVPQEGFGGYYDLYMSYLDARLPLPCTDIEDEADRAACEANPSTRPAFQNVVLPAGY